MTIGPQGNVFVAVFLLAVGIVWLGLNLRGYHPGSHLFGVVSIPLSYWFPVLLVVLGIWLGGVSVARLAAESTPTPIAASPPTPTAEPVQAIATPEPTVLASPSATSLPPGAYWVKNHTVTEMWSGPVGQASAISFGTTSGQFCTFLVVRPQDNARLYVLNPYSNDYFWIDAAAIGPAPEPVRLSGTKPADQNCAEAIYGS